MTDKTPTAPIPTKRVDLTQATVPDASVDMLAEARAAALAAREESAEKAKAQAEKSKHPVVAPKAQPAPLPDQPGRERALDEASALGAADEKDLGAPEDRLTRIAAVWSMILGSRITGKQVSAMLVGMQLAHLAHNPDSEIAFVEAISAAAAGVEVTK